MSRTQNKGTPFVVDRCDDCGNPRERCLCDPTTGVVLRADAARTRCRAKPWHWNPGREIKFGDGSSKWIYPDVEIGVRDVHGRGWASAHHGTVGEVQEAPEDRACRQAGLTVEERAVFDLQAQRVTYVEIAVRLRISLRQVESRASSMRRKLREIREALGSGGMHA